MIYRHCKRQNDLAFSRGFIFMKLHICENQTIAKISEFTALCDFPAIDHTNIP